MMTKLLASAALALLGGAATASVPAAGTLGQATPALPAGTLQMAATTFIAGDGTTASLSGSDGQGQHAGHKDDDANDDSHDDHSGMGSDDHGSDDHGADDHGSDDHGGDDHGGSGDGGSGGGDHDD